ncbi:dma1, component of spindle assembly checkpoint [Fusarium agapanthi]|uniref:RING-type E3 ubiquitin transferase n=1 Tax=Fusarium agapanthi TaxID=1803897 RepID=A0A9P5B835_9HYPO|nr:dma1, component of spindle assembly checkpoint [Fusarium agapanthi]
MFTQPVVSTPTGPPQSSSTSTSRPSRLRGLSYLRNYTQNHLLSRDNHHNNSSSGSAGGTGTGTASARSTSPNRHGSSLTRSLSHSPTTSGPSTGTQNTNHLTLVSSTPDPVRNLTSATTTTSIPALRPTSVPASASAATDAATTNSTESPKASSQHSADINDPATAAPEFSMTADTQASAAAAAGLVDSNHGQPTMTRSRSATTGEGGSSTPETAPSIRFSAYYDPRSTRPSLTFPPISRTLPTGSEKIRVGRYSERDSHSMSNMPGNQPSAAPVGFKSKVVSRRHCEFWYEDGKWYIKDVKSSSGTFLNHIRLSPPSQESKAFPVNDGDIVQLGIDFKGGEEMIFRCVKMRLELNRGWQNKLNTFNMAAHKRLQTMASSGAVGTNSQDCSICLSSIAPCQSLFVAPCSHTWHFKCVRSLLSSPQYPIFICPNCRAGADLEADVDELAEEWQQLKNEAEAEASTPAQADTEPETDPVSAAADSGTSTPERSHTADIDHMDVTVNITPETPQRNEVSHAISEPLPIRNAASAPRRVGQLGDSRTPSPPGGTEGPITPRNNVGPWVFDGSAGRTVSATEGEMTSIDAAAQPDTSEHDITAR